MDAINAALYAAFTADSQFMAAAPGGIWNQKADEGTPLPLGKFQLVGGDPDYVFGGSISSERYVYKITAHAEDNATNAGAYMSSIAAGHIKRVANTAALAVAGYTALCCRWFALVPPMNVPGRSGKDEYSEGVLVEIVVAPA